MLPRSRFRRALGWAGKALAALVLVLVAVVVLALAALNTPFARNFIATRVNALLASEFRGTLAIEHIGRIDPFGVAGARVRARDPEGRPVLFADGLNARVDTVRLVRSLIRGGAIEVEIGLASATHVDLSLDADSRGELLLLRTFALRESVKTAPLPSSPPSVGVRLTISEAALRHAWVHGRPPGAPLLDVEVRDAAGSVFMDPNRMEIVVSRCQVEGRGLPEGANPRGEVAGRIFLPTGKNSVFAGQFHGDVGGLRTSALARLEGKELTASLVVQTVENVPWTVVPEVPLAGPLRIRADASGPLSKLAVQARANLGHGTVDVDGEVSLDPIVKISATVRAKHIDLSDVASSAPRSDLSALADASIVVQGGEAHGDIRVMTEPSRIGAEAIPSIVASGRLDGNRLDARVLAEQHGARAFALACLRKAGEETLLDFDVKADVPNLRRIPGAPGSLQGRGRLFADGVLHLESKRVEGHVVGDVSDLSSGDLGLRRGFVDARVDGIVTSPRIDGALYAEQIVVGKSKFLSVSGHVRGTLAEARVSASAEGDKNNPSLAANGRVQIGRAITLRDVSAVSDRDGSTVMAGVNVVRIAGHDLRVEHAVVLGLGESVRADARLAPHEIRIRLDSPSVDLRRVAKALGLTAGRFHGNVAAAVDLVARRSGATGRARVDLTDAAFDDGSRGQGHLDVAVDRDRVSGTLHGTWSGSRVDLDASELRLGGPPTETKSWSRAFGRAFLDADIDLGGLRKLVPEGMLPFEPLEGRVKVSLGVSRKTAGAMPEATLSVRTTGFRVSRKGTAMEPSDGTTVRSPAAWVVSGVDFDLDAATDEDGDEATFHGRLRDEHGTIADVWVGSVFPPAAVLTDPSRMRAFLETSPIEARVSVPRRDIAALPGAFGQTTMDGSVELTANAKGTLRDPKVDLVFDLRDFRTQHHTRIPPVGAHVAATYDGREGKVEATVASAGKPALSATALGHVAIGDLLAKGAAATWDASARAKLERLSLESVPGLTDQRVRGSVTGDLDLSVGTQTPPHFHAKLDANPLSVGRFRDNTLYVQVDVTERALEAAARVEQKDGFLAAKAAIGVAWPALVSPQRGPPPATEPAHLSMQARNFRLAVFRPFVRDVVQRVDGRLDGDVVVDVADHGRKTTTRGHLSVKDGVFELPNVGEEFREVRAKATFQPNGVIVADDLYAKGTTGSVRGSAAVRLDGLSLASARADFDIPQKESLPISIEGQVLAEAWGKVHAELTRAPGSGEIDVTVNVPVGGVRLPDRSPRSLQELEPAERVRIGIYRAPGQFEVLQQGPIVTSTMTESADAPGARIAVHVKDVEIRRGTSLRVRLEGNPVVKMGRDAGVSGTVLLREGFIEVQGKRFEIERGIVTFDGEADNPEVVFTAGWTAPEGTRVYADFVGPLKTGKMTLRSDPAHTNTEILSLILFGTTTGSSAPGATTTGSAAGVGGDLATKGLTRALDDVTGLDLTARVDTSDAANPRPELEVRIARDITVAIAHVLGVPPPGMNPDRNLATVDWRFRRNWSLQTTFGDAGSSLLDFVWQYRY
jgi:translocation and assembly module TamB